MRVPTGGELVKAFVTDWRVILGCAIIFVIFLVAAILLYLRGLKYQKKSKTVKKDIRRRVELKKSSGILEEPQTRLEKRQQKKQLKRGAKAELEEDLLMMTRIRELADEEDHDGMMDFVMDMVKGEGTTR